MITFAWRHYKIQIVAGLLIFAGLILASICNQEWGNSIDWFEAIAGVGTLFLAIVLWFNGIRREWVENLPKRMTVEFVWQGRNVMVCYDAILINESDARTWALQIGQQMSRCQRLAFEPYFNFQKLGVQSNKSDNTKFNSYIFTYYLKTLPEPDAEDDAGKLAFKTRLENGCEEFYYQYHQDGSISMTQGYTPSKSQKMRPN
ncbi:MAG: hypothetical protein J0L99_20310 [Chitinophagales bacterium]|nr:hypothetical protein [Chitinophagales bacterium]